MLGVIGIKLYMMVPHNTQNLKLLVLGLKIFLMQKNITGMLKDGIINLVCLMKLECIGILVQGQMQA